MLAKFIERTSLHRRWWWLMARRVKQIINGSKWVVAGAIVFRDDGRLLLIKHRWRGGWEYPVGMTDKTESPMDAARREIAEEVGLELDSLQLLGVDFFRRRTPNGNLVLTFSALISQSQSESVTIDPFEATAYRWVTREEALRLVKPWLRRRLKELFSAYDAGQPVYLHGGYSVTE